MKRPLALPLVPLYAAGVALRNWRIESGKEQVRRLALPVVSIGSLSAGGAGKTPFVIALVQLLQAQGLGVDVLSRGYGRTSLDARQVVPDGSAEDYGDEPLLIAREARVATWVAARRYEAGVLAEAAASGIVLHLLDDGFQHRQLARSVDIALVSSEDLQDCLLPAGNLREPVSALKRAHVLAVPTGDDQAVALLRGKGFNQPIWRYRREMTVPQGNGSQAGGPVAAFCGIARPDQFFAGLEAAGVRVATRKAFADHHRFTAGDVALLRQLAVKAGTNSFLTTAKDFVRLGALAAGLPVQAAELRVHFEDAAGLGDWLRHHLGM